MALARYGLPTEGELESPRRTQTLHGLRVQAPGETTPPSENLAQPGSFKFKLRGSFEAGGGFCGGRTGETAPGTQTPTPTPGSGAADARRSYPGMRPGGT